MYLTRIEMNGFKSFNTKKELLIKEGITGVVGPNGSGKSNIADAIRWVLGEQSSKNLRGSKMEDVIFNGSEDTGRKGFCEVELVFDNSDGKVHSEYTELSVRRKMYRSGESEYYINGSQCRLKDIIEMFRDTGIGKEGYSIIGQGRIDEILNSKPAARRRVFEEAAGIMKFRARKEEAEHNLSKTQDNLVRIEDIICELEVQVEPLKSQMDVAKRFISLTERLKMLEVNLYLYNHDHLIDKIKRLELQQESNQQEYDDCVKYLSEMSLRLSELKKRLTEVQIIIESSTADISGLGNEQARLRGEYNVVLEKEKNLSENRTLLEQSVAVNDTTITDNENKLDEINSEIEKLNTGIDDCSQRIELLVSDKNEIQNQISVADENLAEKRSAVDAARSSLEACKLTISEKTVRAEDLQNQKNQISSSDYNSALLCRQLADEINVYKTSEQEKINSKQELIRQANNVSSEMSLLKKEYDEKLLELNNFKIEISKKQSSVQLLSNLKDSYEGYAAGVKSLFAPGQHNYNMFGTVADVINVPKEYEIAIETLLGNTLQNVVIRTEKDAKNAIDFLRRENKGRVTFLPVDSLQIKYLTDSEKNSITGRIIGVASELIDCGQDVRPAIDFLLARTVLVEGLDDAFDVMRATGYGVRAVTLKGDIVRPGGSVTGGSVDKKTHGFLERNRMVEELSEQLKRDLLKLQDIENICAEKKGQLSEQEQKRAELIKEVQTAELAVTEIRSELKTREDRYELLMSQNRVTVEHLNNIEKELSDITASLQLSHSELAGYEESLNVAVSALEQCEAENKENSQNASGILLEIQQAELERQGLLRSKEKYLVEGEHLRSDISRCSEERAMSEEKIISITQELEDNLARSRRDILEQLDDITLNIKNTSDNMQKVFNEKEEIGSEIEKLEKAVADSGEKQSGLIEQKYSLSAQVDKCRLRQEAVETRIWDDYTLTYAAALEYKSAEFSVNSGSREIEEIKGKLHDMGVVNPNAIEDFARVNERLQDLIVQKQDLEKASNDLREVIDSLLSDMQSCFNDKFSMINNKFQEIFKTLFGGGRAELVVLDSEDASESGIDIIAEPPGKKLQSLSLLSGGEKALCAIALLFAMLDINPSPICLLDEIDAPLDDANLYRFSDYLKKLSADLQFIVITHRKPTMSVCDTLYGIAMRKKGISEILSVDLN